MSGPGKSELDPEQCLATLRGLDQEREDLIKRQAAMGERHNAAQRELGQLVEQMKALGTSPQTIQADLTRSSEELGQKTAQYQASLNQLRAQLNAADEALLDL